jgi:hypothetical protein
MYFSISFTMKAISSVPSGGARPARLALGRKSAQARLSPSGNTTPKCSRLATSGHDVRVIMSAPVWVLPCRAMTSGAGLVSASCAVNVRVTPPTFSCSANAGHAQAIVTATASPNTRTNRFIAMEIPALSKFQVSPSELS